MYGKRISILALGFFLGVLCANGTGNTDGLGEFLDVFARVHPTSTVPSGVGVSDVCGSVIDQQYFSQTNGFVAAVDAYCTNLCNQTAISARDRSRIKSCFEILRHYQRAEYVLPTCSTSCSDPEVSQVAAYLYSEIMGGDVSLLQYYRSAAVQNLPLARRKAVGENLLLAFDVNGGCAASTNRMIALGVEIVAGGDAVSGVTDELLSSWWPDYATSSNRYVAAQRALQTIPPPASSNYLNRVIAELEALPPGTMRMLSTNHLGQAWQE